LKTNFSQSLVFAAAFFLTQSTVFSQTGHIIWQDDFNSIDPTVWNIDQGDGCNEGLCGWGNFELQSYQNENVYIEEIAGEPGNYALVLEARRENSGNSSFTSGKVTTKNNLAVKYGMIEFRIKVPDDLSKGLWPAAWLLGTNQAADGWPFCGEIDMMEMGHNTSFRNEQEFPSANENNLVAGNLIFYDEDACADNNQTCAASISFDKYYNQPYHTSETLTDRFMIYRMYWDEEQIRLTVDDNGNVQNLYTGPFPISDNSSAFTKPFYLLLNLAVGGNFTDASNSSQVTAELPGKMYIDYVRIKKWNGRGEVFGADQVMANAGANKTIPENEPITLDASGSYGPITSYEWSLDGNVVATTKTHEISLNAGTHIFTLTVSDEQGYSSTDTLKVTVGDNEIGNVIWEDNFESFNPDYWNIDIGDGCEEDLCGWGNQELQSYQEDNVYIEEIDSEPGNFALVLEAKKETVGNSDFTSGKVTTENKVAIKYGVVEVRMKAPDVANGLWPAAWLLGINHREVGWPYCGEIDMMEMGHAASERQAEGFSGSANNFVRANLLWYASGACDTENPTCAASIAFDKYYTTPYTPSSALNNRFVTYRMYWNESQIRLTVVDGNTEHDLYTNPFPIGPNEGAFTKPYYFLLNLAVGGSFTGFYNADDITAPLPGKLYIDYVRVKEWNGQGEVSFSGGSVLANAGKDIVKEDLNQDGVETVTLDSSSSYGSIVSYEWSENGVVLSQDAIAELSLSTGVHNIQLKVEDSEGNVSVDYAKIDIRELIWQDNFDTWDKDIWIPEEGDGCEEDLCGWGNFELQSYSADNISIKPVDDEDNNNAIVIEARREDQNGKAFTSGRLKTEGNLSVKYGLVETRIKVPYNLSTGLWPAFWLLGNNLSEVGWPKSGEIDMMEMGYRSQALTDEGFEGATENDVVGGNIIFYSDDSCSGDNQNCAASIAYDKYYTKPYRSSTTLTNRFLTYRMYWDPNEIRLTVVDRDKEYDFYTGPFPLGGDAEEFHLPFFFVMNLAVGGNFTDALQNSQVTADLPGEMLIDYVRVFKWNGYGEVGFGDGPIANAGPDIFQLDEDKDGKELVYLDGSSSAHHTGEISSYQWTIDEEVVGTSPLVTIELDRGVYTATLTVTDAKGRQANDEVLITISNGGLSPIANAGADQSVEDDNGDDIASVTLDGSLSEEVASPIVSYSWSENDIVIATGVSPTVQLSTGVHVITLEVTDEDNGSGRDEVVITVIDPDNNKPVAVAGDDLVINDDDDDDLVEVSFDGSNSTDSDGVIESYSWKANGEVLSQQAVFTTSLSTGIYIIELTVTDDDGDQAVDQFELTVVDPDNSAPVADAGSGIFGIDADMDGEKLIVLDASGSTDDDGTIVSYAWFVDNTLVGTEMEINQVFSLGQHLVTLKVTDDDGVNDTDEITVIVNQLPAADAGVDLVIEDIDSDGSEQVALDASKSSDPDGTLVSYLWSVADTDIGSGENLSATFNVGAHEVVLTVTDNFGSTAEDSLTVFVARLDNAAPIANAGEDIESYANEGLDRLTIQLDGSASSDSDGTIHSYRWLKDNEVIATGSTPYVTFSVGVHELQLEVTDNEGAKAYDTIVITAIEKINIAFQKPVTTSSVEGAYNGDLAVDGDYETRWSSLFEDPQWLTIDLQGVYAIENISLFWETASALAYRIEISTDNTNWTTLASVSSGRGENEEHIVNGQGRFLRLYFTNRNTEYGYSLFEVEVYGGLLDSEPDTEAPTNLNASLDSTTPNSASFLLRAGDNSGIVVFSVTQNNNTETFIGTSGVETTATVDGLTPNTTYEFTIGIKDQSGNISSEIKTITVTTSEEIENTACSGESDTATQGSFEVGYTYLFKTDGTNVIIEFELLGDKQGLNAYLWKESPFTETSMSNVEGQRFRAVLADQTYGESLSYACKFAFQNGLAVTEYITYNVGDDCSGNVDDPDDDADGISNDNDQCPNTPTGSSVDEFGCEIEVSNKINYYPNPTDGLVVFNIVGEDQGVYASVFDIRGKRMYFQYHTIGSSRQTELDLSNLSRGIYFVQIDGETLHKKVKIIKL
jgi:beta-glucanase (GH16 family)